MTRSVLAATAALLLVATGCYGNTQSLTENGEGFPTLELDFPEETAPGQRVRAVLSVTNPGPGEMTSIAVAFSRLGDPELPAPIVESGGRGGSAGVENVSPEPMAVSPDGVVYTFEGIAVGETAEITFELIMPTQDGPAGNAILVYEGEDPERARGVRLKTEVGG